MSLKSQIESILFVSLKPLSAKELAAACGAKQKEADMALEELFSEYRDSGRGLVLVRNNGQYQFATAAENAAAVQEFLKDETSGELSQPSLEALTIIAYRGPISKLEIEKIRGVNCSLIIRNLLMRGLIEEKFDKSKQENYYTVTADLVRFLGLNDIADLPDYQSLRGQESLAAALAEKLE